MIDCAAVERLDPAVVVLEEDRAVGRVGGVRTAQRVDAAVAEDDGRARLDRERWTAATLKVSNSPE